MEHQAQCVICVLCRASGRAPVYIWAWLFWMSGSKSSPRAVLRCYFVVPCPLFHYWKIANFWECENFIFTITWRDAQETSSFKCRIHFNLHKGNKWYSSRKSFKWYLAKSQIYFYLYVNYFVFNLQQDSNSRYSALNVQHQMLKVSILKLFFVIK